MPVTTYEAKGTGYYPDASSLEGGFTDRHGHPLRTLQDFVNGKSEYVSVAMDKELNIPYGTKLRIPEIEDAYKTKIEFRVVDTGSAFTGKGYARIDICTADSTASLDPAINRILTLQFCSSMPDP
jgi:3D (Asp-Asp-Asp) domain-containing protein